MGRAEIPIWMQRTCRWRARTSENHTHRLFCGLSLRTVLGTALFSGASAMKVPHRRRFLQVAACAAAGENAVTQAQRFT